VVRLPPNRSTRISRVPSGWVLFHFLFLVFEISQGYADDHAAVSMSLAHKMARESLSHNHDVIHSYSSFGPIYLETLNLALVNSSRCFYPRALVLWKLPSSISRERVYRDQPEGYRVSVSTSLSILSYPLLRSSSLTLAFSPPFLPSSTYILTKTTITFRVTQRSE
jgi:hypothetical protein